MLSPSEKIRIITEISRRLSQEGWPIIDLTLRQFSLPTTDNWQGDRLSYILEMIDPVATDEQLIALSSHVGFDLSRPSGLEPSFWTNGYLKLFLSHLAIYKNQATELQWALAKYGISTFVAHCDIEPTKEWQDEIELALSTADALVAMLTPDFHDSKWTDQEIGFAMGRRLLILSLRLGQDPYGFIGKYQGIEAKKLKAADIAHKIFKVFLDNKQTARSMKEALITLFELSNTYQEAKDRMTLLEQTNEWPDSLVVRIEQATENNSQIKDSFGVPERIKRLLDNRAKT